MYHSHRRRIADHGPHDHRRLRHPAAGCSWKTPDARPCAFFYPFSEAARAGSRSPPAAATTAATGHVMARYLSQKGYPLTVYLLCTADRVQGDAAANLRLLYDLGVPVVEVPDERVGRPPGTDGLRRRLDRCHFRHGAHATVDGFYRNVIESSTSSIGRCLPSISFGLDADTGRPCGPASTPRSPPPSPFQDRPRRFPGASHTGRLEVVDIASRRTSPIGWHRGSF